jgi:O-methyltransferase
MLRGIYDVLTNPAMRHEWRWRVLKDVAKWVLPNYRLQWPQMVWWEDEEFNSFLKHFHEYGGYNTDRRWMIHELSKLALNVPGDTAECGVMEGSSSYLICKRLNRTHYMFDSFEGCSAPGEGDSGFFPKHTLAVPIDVVKENFADFPNAVIMQGWIPDRFPEIQDRRFAFVHIDVQQAQPTRDSLKFFYPRMNPGGVIVMDDYGFTICPGARKVIDEFIADKPEPIIATSTASAFIIKGVRKDPPQIK